MPVRPTKRGVLVLFTALLDGGCADPAQERADRPAGAVGIGVEHVAVGVVESVDPVGGTAVIDHEPVAGIGMPAMRMTFRLADPSLAVALRPGDPVRFLFVVDDGVLVTRVLPPEADRAR